jgi:hypothetical protein
MNNYCFHLIYFLSTCALCLSGCSENQPSGNLPVENSLPAKSLQGGLKFTAPDEWIQETPSSTMRIAQYRLPSDNPQNGEAELAIFYFQGQGGSVQTNLDRWIGQFETQNQDTAHITEIHANNLHLTVLDISGTYQASMGPVAPTVSKPNYQMLAAVAEGSGGPWFLKLTGPKSTVKHWEKSFHLFLGTLQTSQ